MMSVDRLFANAKSSTLLCKLIFLVIRVNNSVLLNVLQRSAVFGIIALYARETILYNTKPENKETHLSSLFSSNRNENNHKLLVIGAGTSALLRGDRPTRKYL